MPANIEWTTTPSTAWNNNYTHWLNKIFKAVEKAMEARAIEIGQWMKENAKWDDRTHLARASLNSKVFMEDMKIYVVMYYGADIDHSWWLEGHMWNGHRRGKGNPWRFSILKPALHYWGPILIADVKKMLEG